MFLVLNFLDFFNPKLNRMKTPNQTIFPIFFCFQIAGKEPPYKLLKICEVAVEIYSTRISGHYGPLKILAPAECLLARFAHILLLLSIKMNIATIPSDRKYLPPPSVNIKARKSAED